MAALSVASAPLFAASSAGALDATGAANDAVAHICLLDPIATGALGSRVRCVTTTLAEADAFAAAHGATTPSASPFITSVKAPAAGLTVNTDDYVFCDAAACATAENAVYLGRNTKDIHFAGENWDWWGGAGGCSTVLSYGLSDFTGYSGANDAFSSAYIAGACNRFWHYSDSNYGGDSFNLWSSYSVCNDFTNVQNCNFVDTYPSARTNYNDVASSLLWTVW